MRKTALISAALGLFAMTAALVPLSSASAQQATQQSAARPATVTRFDDTMMRYLLADLRAQWQVEREADGSLTYRASTENGINFVLAPRACETADNCVGLMLIALFNDVGATSAARLDAFINQYNDRNPTAKIMRNAQGMVALQDYINVAYGSNYRNVQAQILVFGENISNLSRALVAFENAQ